MITNYEEEKVTKKRFRYILGRNKKRNGFYILVCAGVLTLGIGMLTGCSVLKDKAEVRAESAESQFVQMAGNWQIDFDRTDAAIWGSGISEGNSMEISETGAFRYAIGIGVGGTGQCVEKDGAVTVEVEPYESHSSEKEILTLTYGNDTGKETILMDWNGEKVYWVRTEQEPVSDNSGADNASNRTTETYVAGSRQILGYVSKFDNDTVAVDLQDWVTRDNPNWKPEYDEAAGFEIVDIAGADVTYLLRSDCQFFILENHQGESIEIDKEAFAKYLKDTDFPIFWGMEVVEGEIISFAEWYRP